MGYSRMADKSNYFDIVEIVVVYILPFVVVVWKGIDKYFEYQSKKDKEFVKELVSELLTGALQGITRDIKELKDDRKKDYELFNETVVNIYKELKKN